MVKRGLVPEEGGFVVDGSVQKMEDMDGEVAQSAGISCDVHSCTVQHCVRMRTCRIFLRGVV